MDAKRLCAKINRFFESPPVPLDRSQKRIYGIALILTFCEFGMIQAKPIATIYGVQPYAIGMDDLDVGSKYQTKLMDVQEWKGNAAIFEQRLRTEKDPVARARDIQFLANAKRHIAERVAIADRTQQ